MWIVSTMSSFYHIVTEKKLFVLFWMCDLISLTIHCMGQNIKSLAACVCVRALTSGPLWGSACVYHGLVGSAWLVADLWGSPQKITLNLSVLGYFKSFERYLFFPHKATCVSRTRVSFPFPTRHNWRVRKISVCRRSATAAASAA